LSKSILEKAESLAIRLAEQFQVVGVLAVEMFVLKNGEVLVNEVAPRPHNSGHHTIECCITSQYEQHLRAILNWPLGSTAILQPAVMINLLGDKDCQGSAVYQGMETVLKESGIYVHLYGKEKTSPFRKMGHVTVMDKDIEVAKVKARWVMKTLRVVSE
jgi:5-(carboxyamino)imidazole ribonucleotide synthase